MMRFKLALGVLLLAGALIFTAQNAIAVDVKFLAWKFSTSLALIIFATLAGGFIAGWATFSAIRIKGRVQKQFS